MNSVLLKMVLTIPSVLASQSGWTSQTLTLGSLHPRCTHVLEGTRSWRPADHGTEGGSKPFCHILRVGWLAEARTWFREGMEAY